MLFAVGGLAFLSLAAACLAVSPAIIPLPKQMEVRPGVFTLCASRPASGAPARAVTRILVDPPSLETGQYLATMLFHSTGCQFIVATNAAAGPIRGAILLTTVNALASLGAEGYELTVAPDSVVIRAPAQAGLFYGVQSLLQLLPPQILSPRPVTGVAWVAPCVYIQDQPRFPWRGLMLDVARHFFDKQEVERVLDAMALHKLNTFHWHLTDDQGWRLEIPDYPLLTQTAAWRSSMDYGLNPRASTAWNSSGKYGGYYTASDIAEVVAYAQQRHITVVPEIEMPSHCQAAVQAYPALGCGNLSTAYNPDSIKWGVDLFSLGLTNYVSGYTNTWPFFTNVLNTVMSLFPGPYIHCGGDEVVPVYNAGDRQWLTYPNDANQMTALGISTSGRSASYEQYQHWFSTNLANYIRYKGRTMIGWGEIDAAGVINNAVLMDWDSGNSYALEAAEAGQQVVMALDDNCYLNYCETGNGSTVPPAEPFFIVGGKPIVLDVQTVYNFEPVPSALSSSPYATNILGAQCCLWGEYVPSPENVEFKLFPRLCAMAEVTWTPAASKNYTDFSNRLLTQEQRLAQMGINYNHGAVTQIGAWTSPVASQSPTYTTVTYDITPYVNQAGEIDINFDYTGGNNALNINSVALLEDGVQVDIDNNYLATSSLFPTYLSFPQNTSYYTPYFVVRLPWYHPGSTYTIQAAIAGWGGTDSTGTVYLVNWN